MVDLDESGEIVLEEMRKLLGLDSWGEDFASSGLFRGLRGFMACPVGWGVSVKGLLLKGCIDDCGPSMATGPFERFSGQFRDI